MALEDRFVKYAIIINKIKYAKKSCTAEVQLHYDVLIHQIQLDVVLNASQVNLVWQHVYC